MTARNESATLLISSRPWTSSSTSTRPSATRSAASATLASGLVIERMIRNVMHGGQQQRHDADHDRERQRAVDGRRDVRADDVLVIADLSVQLVEQVADQVGDVGVADGDVLDAERDGGLLLRRAERLLTFLSVAYILLVQPL